MVSKFDHQLLLEYERVLKESGVPSLDFIHVHSQVGEVDAKMKIQLVSIEVQQKLEQGEPIDINSYVAALPDLADEIANIVRGSVKTFIKDCCPLSKRYGKLPCYFGEYEIVEELGRGGMGVVYRARTLAGLEVALKTLFFDHHLVNREAAILAQLDHPSICKLIDAGKHDGISYFCQTLVGGELWTSASMNDSRFKQFRAARIVLETAHGLAQAHSKGIAHFDVKPQNILINSAGDMHLIDFGLARLASENYATPAEFDMAKACGSPEYMAPELFDSEFGDLGPTCDVYSLGATLYQLLTDITPYQGSFEQVKKIVSQYPPARPNDFPGVNICSDLEAICLKAMSRYVSDRFATMSEFGSHLASWLHGRSLAE